MQFQQREAENLAAVRARFRELVELQRDQVRPLIPVPNMAEFVHSNFFFPKSIKLEKVQGEPLVSIPQSGQGGQVEIVDITGSDDTAAPSAQPSSAGAEMANGSSVPSSASAVQAGGHAGSAGTPKEGDAAKAPGAAQTAVFAPPPATAMTTTASSTAGTQDSSAVPSSLPKRAAVLAEAKQELAQQQKAREQQQQRLQLIKDRVLEEMRSKVAAAGEAAKQHLQRTGGQVPPFTLPVGEAQQEVERWREQRSKAPDTSGIRPNLELFSAAQREAYRVQQQRQQEQQRRLMQQAETQQSLRAQQGQTPLQVQPQPLVLPSAVQQLQRPVVQHHPPVQGQQPAVQHPVVQPPFVRHPGVQGQPPDVQQQAHHAVVAPPVPTPQQQQPREEPSLTQIFKGPSSYRIPAKVLRAEEVVNAVPFISLEEQSVEFLQAMLKDIVAKQGRESGPCLEPLTKATLLPPKKKKKPVESTSPSSPSVAMDPPSDELEVLPEAENPAPASAPSATVDVVDVDELFGSDSEDESDCNSAAEIPPAAPEEKTESTPAPQSSTHTKGKGTAKARKPKRNSLMPGRAKKVAVKPVVESLSTTGEKGDESALERDLRLLLNIVKRRKREPDVDVLTPAELVDNLGSLLGLTNGHKFLTLPTLLNVIYGYVKGRGWTNYNKGILPACETLRSAVRVHLESLNDSYQ